MAASVQITDLEEKLSCAVCFETFNEDRRLPKALTCLHTVCLVCLEEMKNLTGFCCPICRDPIDDIDDLKTNFALLELMPLLEENNEEEEELITPMCRIHKKSTISHYCINCNKSFCGKCFAATVRKASSHYGHDIQEYDELQVSLKQNIDKQLQHAKQQLIDLEQKKAEVLSRLNGDKDALKQKVSSIAEDLTNALIMWQSNLNSDIEEAFTQMTFDAEIKYSEQKSKVEDEMQNMEEDIKVVKEGKINRDVVKDHHAGYTMVDMSEAMEEIGQISEHKLQITEYNPVVLPRLVNESDCVASEEDLW